MTTTGAVDVNLSPIGNSINNGTELGSKVIGGVKDQGDLIGLAIGISIAIGLLFGVVFLVITILKRMIGSVKGFHKGG